MVARQGEELVLRWKFRLPEGMQTTKNFCHVHQIKGIDNSEAWPTWPIPSHYLYGPYARTASRNCR